jgi:hypothetical protein
VPGAGTELALNGNRLGVVEGADFAAAYFRIWLGDSPVDTRLRDQLLGCDRHDSDKKQAVTRDVEGFFAAQRAPSDQRRPVGIAVEDGHSAERETGNRSRFLALLGDFRGRSENPRRALKLLKCKDLF